MTSRSIQDESALQAAADYVQVYTRPLKTEEPDVPRLNRGCFQCSHTTPSMSSGLYTTIFGLIMKEGNGPPNFKKTFGVTVCFADKAWEGEGSFWKATYKPAYQKFPLLSNTYNTVGKLLREVNPYVRLVAYQDGPTKHVNNRINVANLLGEEEYEAKTDLVLVAQPGWQTNCYIDPSWSIGSEALTLESMRFARPPDRDSFMKGWVKQNALDLTPVPGLKSKKVRKPSISDVGL